MQSRFSSTTILFSLVSLIGLTGLFLLTFLSARGVPMVTGEHQRETIHTQEYEDLTGNTSTGSAFGICVEQPRIFVIMYHYVRDPIAHDAPITHNLSVSKDLFRSHMTHLVAMKDSGKIFLATTDQLSGFYQTHCYPHQNIFVLTADDGWEDSYYNLWSIANTYGVPFTFGVIADNIGKPGYMTLDEVHIIAKNRNYSFASHSLTHKEMSSIPPEEQEAEMCHSRTKIEQMTGGPVTTFIYPAGRMTPLSIGLAEKCGYSLAFSTSFGETWDQSISKQNVNRYRINRDTQPTFFDSLIISGKH